MGTYYFYVFTILKIPTQKHPRYIIMYLCTFCPSYTRTKDNDKDYKDWTGVEKD